jgi:hypothetical protein
VSKKAACKSTFIILATLAYSLGSPAAGKIGASIRTFQANNGRLFVFKNRTVKEDKTYYVYSLISHPAQQHSSPGFAGGITLTTSGDKILGESLILRLGADQEVGKVLAVAICMDLTYEAIGKPAPKTQSLRATEFNSYSDAITRGLAGLPQVIKYKGYPMKITVSRTNEGELLLAIVPLPTATDKTTKQQ